MRVKVSKQPPPASTTSAIGPCHTVIKIVGRPGTGSLPSTIALPPSRCGWRLFGHFYSALSFLLVSPSLWGTGRYRLKYCLKEPLSQKKKKNIMYRRFSQLYPTHSRLVYDPTGEKARRTIKESKKKCWKQYVSKLIGWLVD